MASPGSQLPGGYILGALSHADRIGLVYEAFLAEGRGPKCRALVLHPLHVDELRDWFERTAVLGRGLKHPNLVEVHALGYTANQLPVMITEWTDGRTLRSRIAGGEVIPVAEIRRIIDEVASALEYLHGRSPPVLHRVLMPETVLIPPAPLPVKLLAVGHADRPQHPASKANYLSPEELSGERDLTAAADIFSLASLAFEAITGRAAFAGNSASAVLSAVQRRLLPYIALAPQEGLHPLDELFHRAWSLDPARRPASASAFARDLDDALAQVPGTLLTSRRTVREGVVRANTIPPTVAAMPRPVGSRHPTPIPNLARVSTRPPPMNSAPQSNRPISPFLGPATGPSRFGGNLGQSAMPGRGSTAGAEVSGAYRRHEGDVNSWLNLDHGERVTHPVVHALDAGGAPSPEAVATPLPVAFDDDAEITSAIVDIDDPEVLELLSEEFTSPAIASPLARSLRSGEGLPFDIDPPERPSPVAPSLPPPPPPDARRSRAPGPMRSQTQPAGYPRAMFQRYPTPVRVERPAQFDRPPVSPFAPAEPRPRDEQGSLPWHSRELKFTPWVISVVLALNLLLTAALVVVLRYFLG